MSFAVATKKGGKRFPGTRFVLPPFSFSLARPPVFDFDDCLEPLYAIKTDRACKTAEVGSRAFFSVPLKSFSFFLWLWRFLQRITN